jgi:hypothetical protein
MNPQMNRRLAIFAFVAVVLSCDGSVGPLVDGTCGSANGAAASIAPTTGLCDAGTASEVTGTGPWTWSCAGARGRTAQCSAPQGSSTPVNGVCGPADGVAVSSAPATGLCDVGTPTTVSGSGPWSWTCAGGNGGNSANCSADKDSGTGTCPADTVGTPPDCFPTPPAEAANGKHWKVTYSEEFDETTLDTTKLTPCFDWNYGACTCSFNSGKERYLPSQVQISNGTAKLVAEPLSPPYANSGCYKGQCTYKAGLVSTARQRADDGSDYLFPFTYGYIESKMKFPGVPGFFTAFWMLPTDPTYSYRSEIDIVEILGGDPDTIFMTYHYNNRSQSYTPNNGDHNNGACEVKDYSADWVTFGMDWESTHVAWYIDGIKCGQFDGDSTTIESGPMQLILHMMIDNSWERSWGLVLANQTLVNQLEVDYIRIYQQE